MPAVVPPAAGLPAPVRLELELDGAGWLLHVKARAVSLAVADAENYTFDLEGRPYAAYVGGRNYRRGLDGRIDDPKAGWKGRGLWTTSGNRTPQHIEGGKGTKPKVR